MDLLCKALTIYWVICIARMFFSFLPSSEGGLLSAVESLVFNLTEPLFASARRLLPGSAGDLPIDVGAIVVFVGILVLQRFVCII